MRAASLLCSPITPLESARSTDEDGDAADGFGTGGNGKDGGGDQDKDEGKNEDNKDEANQIDRVGQGEDDGDEDDEDEDDRDEDNEDEESGDEDDEDEDDGGEDDEDEDDGGEDDGDEDDGGEDDEDDGEDDDKGEEGDGYRDEGQQHQHRLQAGLPFVMTGNQPQSNTQHIPALSGLFTLSVSTGPWSSHVSKNVALEIQRYFPRQSPQDPSCWSHVILSSGMSIWFFAIQ